MSIGVLTSSSLAMLSQSHAMGQISTNIANVNTSGYKASESTFKTQLAHTSGEYNIYSAVASDRRAVDIAGNTIVSGNVHDMTISGEGFFMVTDNLQNPSSAEQYYTRAGDFSTIAVGEGDDLSAYLTTSSGHYVLGWNADRTTGEFSNTLEPINVTPLEYIDGVATSEMEITANIKSDTSQGQNIDVAVYDQNFQSQGLIMHFEPVEGEIANQWILTASVDNGTVTSGPIAVRFDGEGNLIEPAGGQFNLNIVWDEGGSNSIAMDIDNMTQLGDRDTLLYKTEQDGMTNGQLVGVSWDDEGVLHGTYSNTRTIEIAKVAIATFTAPNNLELSSNNLFMYNPAAGQLDINDLSNDDLISTSIQAETYESSNVDLADQFSKMITTQKAYSSAATVFQTGDEMLQTVTALKG